MYFKNILWYSTFNFSSSFEFTVHTFTFTEFTALSIYAVTMDTLLAAGECWTLDTATLVAAIARHFKTICALFFTVLHWGTDWVGIGTLTDFYSFFIHLIPFLTVQVTVGWNTQRGSNIMQPLETSPLGKKSTSACIYYCTYTSHSLIFFKIQVHVIYQMSLNTCRYPIIFDIWSVVSVLLFQIC